MPVALPISRRVGRLWRRFPAKRLACNKGKAIGDASSFGAKNAKRAGGASTNEDAASDMDLDGKNLDDAQKKDAAAGPAAEGNLEDPDLGKSVKGDLSGGSKQEDSGDSGTGTGPGFSKRGDGDMSHPVQKNEPPKEASQDAGDGAVNNAMKNLESKKISFNKAKDRRKDTDSENEQGAETASGKSVVSQGEKSNRQQKLVSVLDSALNSSYDMDPGVSTSRLRSMADAIHFAENGRHRADVSVMPIGTQGSDDGAAMLPLVLEPPKRVGPV